MAGKNEDVDGLVVRFLFNLSFDNELRKKISLAGLLQYVVPMIGMYLASAWPWVELGCRSQRGKNVRLCPSLSAKPPLRQPAILLLYHISIDDESKALFTYTDCIPLVRS